MLITYASIETSRGCPQQSSYCHISTLKDENEAGPIGKLRLKSVETVMRDIRTLKSMGVEWLFFEDDSLLAKPYRAIEIFKQIKKEGLNLADVNGVNLVHLFKRSKNGKLDVNQELLEMMVEVGFKQLVLPFESGSQRIIDKYASGKWSLEKMDVSKLVRKAKEIGLKVPGNFMIGFPDETPKELSTTVDLAKKLVQEGLTYASFFIVIPYPGSKLYEEAISRGNLSKNFDTDVFHWGNPVMENTLIPAEELIRIRKQAWKQVNDPKYVKGKLERQVVPERLDD